MGPPGLPAKVSCDVPLYSGRAVKATSPFPRHAYYKFIPFRMNIINTVSKAFLPVPWVSC